MEALSSRNPRVAELRRLLRQRRAREGARRFVVEGETLLAEALAAGADVTEVFVAANSSLASETTEAIIAAGAACWSIDPAALASVATTQSPQPVLAVVGFVDRSIASLADVGDGSAPLIVVAAGVREPGNAGTLIRSAAAAGATAFVTCDDSVDLYNPKVVRSTVGGLFRLPVVANADVDELFGELDLQGIATVGLDAHADTIYDRHDLTAPTAIVVGNEARGASDSVTSRLGVQLRIPMASGVESLNVASALAVVAFEAARQRR